MSDHWTMNADYISHDGIRWVIGEDEHADWWVPYRDARTPWRKDWLWCRFRRWNPLHWLAYWNARRRNEIVFIAGWEGGITP